MHIIIGILKLKWNYFLQIFETLPKSWKYENKIKKKN